MSDDKKPLNAEEVKAKPHRTFIQLNNLEPDYSHWAKATSWTCTEMIFLVNGVDPDKTLAGKGDTYGNALKYHFEPFITIQKQLKLTDRAQNDEVLPSRNSPLSSTSWCQRMQIPVPFELLSLCVDATNHKLAHDEVLEELKKNAEEKLASSEKEVLKASKTKDAGEDELANRMRLIGALSAMLQDDSISVEDKNSATAIARYIGKNYAPGLENKGLGDETVRKILGKAKKQLEDDGIKG